MNTALSAVHRKANDGCCRPGAGGILSGGVSIRCSNVSWARELAARFSRLSSLGTLVLLLLVCAGAWLHPDSAGAQTMAASGQKTAPKWKNGLPADENFFPIAVWLQDPRNAARFQAAGINLYVGLWQGPTTNQLIALAKAGMPVICSQNKVALANLDNPIIVGWMHDDEPDNAQSLGKGRGYGPPILPEVIVRDYERMRAADPTRPILLNLGQGAAWDNYIGRGTRRNHPEDYPLYIKGCDIASFDIYPVVHDAPEIAGKLEYVARGVQRLRQWAGADKTVWNCIECTHISHPGAKATPRQIRAEVWMALIHGSRGLVYFVHEFKPAFKEAALLADPELLPAVTAINQQIRGLAPALNCPTVRGGASAESSNPEVPIACMLKHRAGVHYLFAVNMRNQPTRGSFTIQGLRGKASAEVLGEARQVAVESGGFSDAFAAYDVHLYRVEASQ